MRTQVLLHTIKTGSVYLFIEDNYKVKTPHFFVLLNNNPLDSSSLLFVNATTKIDKRRKWAKKNNLPLSTLIEVDSTICTIFREKCLFDCNYPNPVPLNTILEKLNSRLFLYKGEVSEDLLMKIQQGVIDSPLVSEEIKKIIKS